MRILIADDDPVGSTMLSRALRRWSLDAIVVHDGQQAWATIQEDPTVGVAIVDWVMPGLDGLELCRRIRADERYNHLHLIMLTARDSRSDLLAALTNGADDYLTKPFDPEELRARVQVGVRVATLQARLSERVTELHASQKELERSNSELGQFVYIASHDLQEPLRMVSSYLGLLSRRYKNALDADADEFIAFAVDGASRMQRLLNDLLVYSRVGTKAKALAPMDAEAAVQAARDNLFVAIGEAKATITVGPMPRVMADETQLIQLFQNLMANAIKFRGDIAPDVHVEVSASDDGGWQFSVRDNGIGIEPQDFERCFVMFQRLNAAAKYPGTGAGLAICKKIVARHGGRIWVESTVGQGTTFFFTMPAVESEAALGESTPEHKPEVPLAS